MYIFQRQHLSSMFWIYCFFLMYIKVIMDIFNASSEFESQILSKRNDKELNSLCCVNNVCLNYYCLQLSFIGIDFNWKLLSQLILLFKSLWIRIVFVTSHCVNKIVMKGYQLKLCFHHTELLPLFHYYCLHMQTIIYIKRIRSQTVSFNILNKIRFFWLTFVI